MSTTPVDCEASFKKAATDKSMELPFTQVGQSSATVTTTLLLELAAL
jgi:hypothetical protein